MLKTGRSHLYHIGRKKAPDVSHGDELRSRLDTWVNRLEDGLLINTMEEWKSRVLKSDRPTVVEFYTPTCPHCARLTPIFRKLSHEYGDKMNFAMVNAAESQDLAEGYGVAGVPTLKFFCDGRPIYEIVGFEPEEELRAEIEKVLQKYQKCISQSTRLYA